MVTRQLRRSLSIPRRWPIIGTRMLLPLQKCYSNESTFARLGWRFTTNSHKQCRMRHIRMSARSLKNMVHNESGVVKHACRTQNVGCRTRDFELERNPQQQVLNTSTLKNKGRDAADTVRLKRLEILNKRTLNTRCLKNNEAGSISMMIEVE